MAAATTARILNFREKLASFELLESVLDSVNNGLLAIDSTGHIIAVSKGFASICAVDRATLRGARATDVLTFERRFRYTPVGEKNVGVPEQRASLIVRGGKPFIAGFAQRRLWFAGRRLLLLTVVKLDSLLEERRQLDQLQENLELKVRVRTVALANKVKELDKARNTLAKTLEDLKLAQDSLIQSEKMIALGELVAGVAHEINTPLGIGVTAASHFQDEVSSLKTLYGEGKLGRRDLEAFISEADEVAGILLTNLGRASELIRSFKQVAVDQTSDELRTFNCREYLTEVLNSLAPKFKGTGYRFALCCDDEISLTNYPGALAQTITNLVLNALIHGLEGREGGHVFVIAEEDEGALHLVVEDNGRGMEDGTVRKIFDPFFTTKRGQGGTGLGLHIVFNLVTQKMGGTIMCESKPGEGTRFAMTFPKQLERADG